MSSKRRDPLLIAGNVLTIIIQVLIGIGIGALAVALPVFLFNQSNIVTELVAENPGVEVTLPAGAIVAVMVLAMVALVLVFLFFRRLRQMIATVGEGDPFVPENADRLSVMAWLMLAVHIIAVPLGALAVHVGDVMEPVMDEDFSWELGLDPGSILMVIVLFILARVFRHGTEMRRDLEGTV